MKRVKILGLIFAVTLMLTACSKSVSYTFNVATGDSIKVKLNVSSGYQLEQSEGTFSVSDENDTEVLQGFFITAEMYESYLASVPESGAEIIETKTENGCTYTQYQLVSDTHTENNFICWIDGSNTGFVLASIAEQAEAEEAFELLSVSYE